MNIEQLIQEIRILRPEALHKAYEAIAEEYRKRLVAQLDLGYDFWIADRVGEVLDIDGEYSLDMPEIVMLVDNAVGFDEFYEWWSQWSDSDNKYRINLWSWLKGARPGMFNKKEE